MSARSSPSATSDSFVLADRTIKLESEATVVSKSVAKSTAIPISDLVANTDVLVGPSKLRSPNPDKIPLRIDTGPQTVHTGITRYGGFHEKKPMTEADGSLAQTQSLRHSCNALEHINPANTPHLTAIEPTRWTAGEVCPFRGHSNPIGFGFQNGRPPSSQPVGRHQGFTRPLLEHGAQDEYLNRDVAQQAWQPFSHNAALHALARASEGRAEVAHLHDAIAGFPYTLKRFPEKFIDYYHSNDSYLVRWIPCILTGQQLIQPLSSGYPVLSFVAEAYLLTGTGRAVVSTVQPEGTYEVKWKDCLVSSFHILQFSKLVHAFWVNSSVAIQSHPPVNPMAANHERLERIRTRRQEGKVKRSNGNGKNLKVTM